MEENLSLSRDNISIEHENIIEEKKEKLLLPPLEKTKGKTQREYEKPYPIAFDAARFVLRDNRTLEQLVHDRNQAQYELNHGHALADKQKLKAARKQGKIAMKKKELTFKEQVQRKATVFDAEAAILYRNKRFLKKDKKPMQRVKQCMAALRNFLAEGDMKEMKRNNSNSLDPNLFWNKVSLAYQATIDACDDYLQHRNPSRWFGKGLERYRMVDNLKKRCREELNDYQNAKDALVQAAIIGSSGDLKNPREVLENIRSTQIIDEPVWMNHGNSTDVYRIRLRMADSNEERTFYMKENLQLLSVNLPKFVDRRLNQLTASKKNMGDVEKEENRMRENHADLTDYENGINFFTAMKNSLDNAKGPERVAMENRYAEFFGQDFDELFKEYHTYMDTLSGKTKLSVADLLKQWQTKLNRDSKNELAKEVVANLKKAGGKKALKAMTAADWIKARIKSGKMGLDSKKDADLIKVLVKMQEKAKEPLKENGAGRLETFFRITCGKEVELYGQMKARGDITDDDIASTNNTATSRLAEKTGFKDLICTSFSSMVNYTRRDGTKGPGFVTIIEEAEGEELVTLQHWAIDRKKKLVMSSKAVMQLQELYCFDLACLQVDRHGRNFKCKYEETENEIIVKTVKAYDNDMSFTEETLDTVFQDEDKKATKKAGFLPPLFKTVKKNSLEYAYIAKNYFQKDVTRELGIKQKAVIHATKEGAQDLELTDLENDKFLSLPLAYNMNVQSQGAVKNRRTGEVLDDHAAQFLKRNLDHIFFNLKHVIYKSQDDQILEDGFQPNDWITKVLIKKESELTKDEKTTLGGLIYELQKLHEDYDLTDMIIDGGFELILKNWGYLDRINEVTDASHRGVIEAWIDSLLFFFSNAYGHNADIMGGYDDKKNISLGDMGRLAIKEGENKPGERGDLYVPTLLHFSYKAYQNLLTMQEKLNTDDELIHDLTDLNITDEKKGKQKRSKLEALRQRVDQQIRQLHEAETTAKIFYKAKGYTGVHAKFFLTDEEAERIGNLSEFSWNPGETYLAIDNDEYMAGQEDFEQLMTQEEKTQWLNATNNRYLDQKRHKFHKVQDLKNPLSNRIHRGN